MIPLSNDYCNKCEHLLDAAHKGDKDRITHLLGGGADIQCKNEYGNTPLHAVAHKGHTEFLKILLAAEADIHAKNMDDITPLYLAVASGISESIMLLLEAGSDVNVKSRSIILQQEVILKSPPIFKAVESRNYMTFG